MGALTIGFVPFEEEKPGYLLALFLPAMDAAVCKPGRQPSPESISAGTLILDFPGSKTVRNRWLRFRTPPVVFGYGNPGCLTQMASVL